MADAIARPRTWAAAAAVVAVLVLGGVLLLGGGADTQTVPGLPTSGRLVTWGVPAARLVLDLAAAVTVGFLLAAAWLLPAGERGRLTPLGGRAVAIATVAAAVWAFASASLIALTLADLLALPPGNLTSAQVGSFVREIPQGRAYALTALIALLVATTAWSVRTRTGAWLALAGALVAVLPPPYTGHAAAADRHDLAVATMCVHVTAAVVWVGGLVALMMLSARDDTHLPTVLPRFSRLALVCFVTVALSGVVNAVLRVPSVPALADSAYGVAVLGKGLALVALGGFGLTWRRRMIPAVTGQADPRRVRAVARQVAALEALVMVATFALAVGLSRTPPPPTGPQVRPAAQAGATAEP